MAVFNYPAKLCTPRQEINYQTPLAANISGQPFSYSELILFLILIDYFEASDISCFSYLGIQCELYNFLRLT